MKNLQKRDKVPSLCSVWPKKSIDSELAFTHRNHRRWSSRVSVGCHNSHRALLRPPAMGPARRWVLPPSMGACAHVRPGASGPCRKTAGIRGCATKSRGLSRHRCTMGRHGGVPVPPAIGEAEVECGASKLKVAALSADEVMLLPRSRGKRSAVAQDGVVGARRRVCTPQPVGGAPRW